MSQTSLHLQQNGTKRRAFLLGNLNQANKSRKHFYQMTDYYIFILLEKARGLLPSQLETISATEVEAWARFWESSFIS